MRAACHGSGLSSKCRWLHAFTPLKQSMGAFFCASRPMGVCCCCLRLVWFGFETNPQLGSPGWPRARSVDQACFEPALVPPFCLFDVSTSYWRGAIPHGGGICISLAAEANSGGMVGLLLTAVSASLPSCFCLFCSLCSDYSDFELAVWRRVTRSPACIPKH